jgi:hypothetical protein
VAGEPMELRGRFVNLLDPELRVRERVRLDPGTRWFLRDLDATSRGTQLLASAGKALPIKTPGKARSFVVEGVANTPGVLLLRTAKAPRYITLDDQPVEASHFSERDGLLWVRFANESRPRTLTIKF